MAIGSQDVRSITELRRHTREVFERVHKTRRPVLLTVDGKPDAVLMDAKTYEKHLKTMNLAALLAKFRVDLSAVAEDDIQEIWTYCPVVGPEAR
jgi:prevent-host-death family protein